MKLSHFFCPVSVLLCIGLAVISPPAHGHTPAKSVAYESASYTSATYITFKIEKAMSRSLIVTWQAPTTRVQLGRTSVAASLRSRPTVPLMVACRGSYRPSLS